LKNRVKLFTATATAFALLLPASAALAAGGTTGADIQISGSASTGSPGPGQPFSYTFQVKNSGPQTASATRFTDQLPVGTTLGFGTVNGFSAPCSSATNANGATVVSCNLSDIAKGGQATVMVSLKAPMSVGTFSNTGTATSSVSDPQLSNNTVSINAQVKVATCALPAGGTTLGGVVAWGSPDASGVMNGFHFYGNDGVGYDVIVNYFDGTQPLTTVINLNCQQTPVQFIQVGEPVSITGTIGSVVGPGATTASPVIYASMIQVPFFKDKI
jgi:uncharacterized repeat protein (TIGR01451 family)